MIYILAALLIYALVAAWCYALCAELDQADRDTDGGARR